MASTGEVYNLIMSLTPSEKRYFKLQAHKFIGYHSRTYEKLFDALLIHPEKKFNEAVFRRMNRGKSFIKNLIEEVQILQTLIMKVMVQYHSGASVEHSLSEMLQEIRFLYTKGLVEDCLKLIERANDLAEKSESAGVKLQLLEFRKLIKDSSVHDNNGFPIDTPPAEIINQGKQAVNDWFSAHKESLNEIKVILLGDAKSGKTSICKKLKFSTFDDNQNQTDGIVIEPFKFKTLAHFSEQKKLHGTTAYFWDFGGQEIMSSTHQFFMTKRSVYMLVLEARRDAEADKTVRAWLERIRTFGGNSLVMVIGNKIDLMPSFGLDTTAIIRDYPEVCCFLNVSCKTDENIEKLKNALEEYIPKAELFDTKIDARWIKIKNDLIKLTATEKKINETQFSAICRKHGVKEIEKQSQVVRFLNDLGIILHFDEISLNEYYILDPLWVTIGVYRIITSEVASRNKGIISISDLTGIVNLESHIADRHRPEYQIKYSSTECRYLADIMAQFKLCYYLHNNDNILIPDLLDKETPQEEFGKFNLALERVTLVYEYRYLPTILIPRLIVELKNDLCKVWRTGLIVKSKTHMNAEAMIISKDNRIEITVVGEYKQKRDYLSVIRYFIDQINSYFTVDVDLYIPLSGYENYKVKFDNLVKMERAGVKKYKNWDIEEEFKISELLDGMLTEEEVERHFGAIIAEQKGVRKLKVFLASSIELKEDREEFEIFINRKNKQLIDKNLFIDLIKWEDFFDAVSETRMQDEYNNAICYSDIFVMLFFTKVGEFTNEEFEVAYNQFKKLKKPSIFTYFKDAPIRTGSLNKRDTLSLLNFEDRLREIKHFSTRYKSIEDLKYQFDMQLEKYLSMD